MGFWTFGYRKKWSVGQDGDLDNALAKFIHMKEKYGDQFQFTIEDLKVKGGTQADVAEAGKIHIKIVVEPRSEEIETQIKALGLTYVE